MNAFFNIILMLLILIIVAIIIIYNVNRNKNSKENDEQDVIEDKTFKIETMMEFVKKRLDEITKINLYDICLLEEE